MFTTSGRRFKPAAGAFIDWSHPLAQGLVCAYAVLEGQGSGLFDLVQYPSRFLKVSAGTFHPTWYGPYVLSGLGGYFTTTTGGTSRLGTARGYTVSLGVQNALVANAAAMSLFGNNSANNAIGFRNNSATSIVWYHFTDDFTVTVPTMTGLRFQFTGSCTPAKIRTAYFNGQSQGTNTATNIPTLNDSIFLGADSNANLSQGYYEHLYAWNRPLSTEEVRWLYAEPYAFIRPTWSFTRFSTIVALTANLSDTLTFSDAIVAGLITPLFLSFNETITFSDVFGSSGAIVKRLLADNIMFTDFIKLLANLNLPLTDTITFADATQLVLKQAGLSLSDTIVFSDNVATQLAAALNLQLSDTIVFTDGMQSALMVSFLAYLRRYLNDV